jgi:hypothetical protein
MKRFVVQLLGSMLLLMSVQVQAQLMKRAIPAGLGKPVIARGVSYQRVDASNVKQMMLEDSILDTVAEVPWRFGENLPADITPYNSGTWSTTTGGTRIWQTGISSPGALSLNFIFHPFRLPAGARLFIYSPDGRQVLGAFDESNNQEDGYFATSLIFSDSVMIEYQEPVGAEFEGVLRIEQITHGYRDPRKFAEKSLATSGWCNINASCEVADAYRDQKRSVLLMMVDGNAFCTGTLINNTRQDGTPYVLSANHCYRTPSTVVFWFNWDSNSCQTSAAPAVIQSVSGAKNRARFAYNSLTFTGSDMWLLELNQDVPYEYNAFFTGWNRTTDPLSIDSVVTLHHPLGDLKKISWSTDSLQIWGYGGTKPIYDTHWRVKSWDKGTTEGGSSGAPLLDQNGLIIGHLHGGHASCALKLPDWFGRFTKSWDGGGTSATQLKPWLDPLGTSPLTLSGMQPVYFSVTTSLLNPDMGFIDDSSWIMAGRSHTVGIVAKEGYYISNVIVDGIVIGPVNTYTFDNISSNHSIHAEFDLITFTLSGSVGKNGMIMPEGEIRVVPGTDVQFSFFPTEGYYIKDVFIDGISIGSPSSYVFSSVNASRTIHVTFASFITHTVTATATANGSINPAGVIVVEPGEDIEFTILPHEGYHISDVAVNGVSIGATDKYLMKDIRSAQSIHASFEQTIYHIIQAGVTGNGAINPSGEVIVAQGKSQAFIISPYSGYRTVNVIADAVNLGAVEQYVFENVQNDHSILAVFEPVMLSVSFVVKDDENRLLTNALVSFDDRKSDPGEYVFRNVRVGNYPYEISLENYITHTGSVSVTDHDVIVPVTLHLISTSASPASETPLQVYPVPSRGSVNIVSAHPLEMIRITDTRGRVLLHRNPGIQQISIDLSGFGYGIYFMQILSGGNIYGHKIQVIP